MKVGKVRAGRRSFRKPTDFLGKGTTGNPAVALRVVSVHCIMILDTVQVYNYVQSLVLGLAFIVMVMIVQTG